MLLWKRVAGIGLVALLLSASPVLLPGGDRCGTAQAAGDQTLSDPSRDTPPTAGDPDGPTGDIAPPTSGSVNGSTAEKQPVRRYSTMVAWKIAIQYWARFTFVR
jgi:hypothetical protein